MTGAELRARRDALGLTQTQLAANLGVDRVTLARWERDVRSPAGNLLDRALRDVEREFLPPDAVADA